LGIDSLSIVFLLLIGFLMCIIVLIVISTLMSNQFYIFSLSLLNINLILNFLSINIFLFFLSFEVILIVMYFLVSKWGSKLYKIRSSFYLFIFTIFGSVLLLIAINPLFIITGSIDLIVLENMMFILTIQISLSLIFTIAFGIKVPIFPFHL
jgi:NADH:ubiquinone oxidoreductase subunit 4 (subunit M)